MRNVLSLLCFTLGSLGGMLRAEYNEIDTEFPMSGPTDFIAEVGVTNVYTGLISGTGPAVIKGGGTVVFSHSNNTYTGGTLISNAVFRLDADGCAGAGAITAAVDKAHIFANCSTVPNDIMISVAASSGSALKPGDYPIDSQAMLFPLCDVTFKGAVEFASYGRYFDYFNDSSAYAPTVTYKKGIKVGNNYLHLYVKGRMIFEDRFIVSDYTTRSMFGPNYGDQGAIEFQASSNYLYQANLRNVSVYLKADDALALTWMHYADGGASYCQTYLTGLQSILGISWGTASASEDSSGQCITSENPATLRITGCDMSRLSSLSLVNKTAIFGKTTLLMDVDPTYTDQGFYQEFSVRKSTTTGDLIISNGNFRMSSTASFPNVPNIYVGRGGTLTNASTKTGAFAGCTSLTVLGAMACTGDAKPFGDATLALTLGNDAKFSLPVGATATVKSLMVGGVTMPDDTYGDGGTPLDQIEQGTVVVRSGNLYVDSASGNDANDGTQGRPFKTIKAATDASRSGDVIHVAPGTYGEAEGTQTVGSTGASRVVVPENVTLKSTDGADVTFIVGAVATGDQIDNETYKTGTNGVRCVYAKSGATIRGFTLMGGRGIGAAEAAGKGRGSAFYSETARAATVADCMVTNNAAYMGTIYQAVVKRCRVFGNVGTRMSSAGVVCAGNSGPAGNLCSWYGSIIDGNVGGATVHSAYAFENCTIGIRNSIPPSDTPQVLWWWGTDDRAIVNSVILGGRYYCDGGGKLYCTNCLVMANMIGQVLKHEQSYNTIFTNAAAAQVDSKTYGPILGQFVGIDKGDAAYSSDALGDIDIYETPRVLNARLDIGAVEYDWRPTFSGEIGKRFTVTYASPSVMTNVTGGLLVKEGAVAGTVTSPDPYLLTFEMTGGTMSVYVGGVLAGECSGTGEQSIRFTVADASDEVRFVFTPDAENPCPAVLKKLSGACGFSIRFR